MGRNYKFKVGDTVYVNQDTPLYPKGTKGIVSRVSKNLEYPYYLKEPKGKCMGAWNDPLLSHLNPVEEEPNSDGASSKYYGEIPFNQFKEVGDQIYWLANNRWKRPDLCTVYKDIFKALCRWGSKPNTSVDYDSRKILYYATEACRIVLGREESIKELKKLVNNLERYTND